MLGEELLVVVGERNYIGRVATLSEVTLSRLQETKLKPIYYENMPLSISILQFTELSFRKNSSREKWPWPVNRA